MNKKSYLVRILKVTLLPLMGLLLSPAPRRKSFPLKKQSPWWLALLLVARLTPARA